MSESHLKNVIEAALLAAGQPVPLADLQRLFEERTRPSTADLRAALAQLSGEYESRGIELKETASGFRIQVRRQYAAAVARLWPERPQRYSRALLETLALIAYRQPITRAEIEAVRGVTVNPDIIKTLLERQWIRVVGHRDLPGRPELLGTTREFLEYFSLKSLDELPPLAQLRMFGELDPQFELGVTGAPEPASAPMSDALGAEEELGLEADAGDGEEYTQRSSGLVAAPPESPD